MRFLFLYFLLAILITLFSCRSEVPEQIRRAYSELPKQVDFNYHIRPILSDRCYACHGPDDNAREAKLRLDTEAGAFAALSNSDGYAIVAGNPGESRIIHRIISDAPDFMMPPPASEMHLSSTEKALIYKWIEQGAKWKKHWAFIPPVANDLPEVGNADWCLSELDFFTLAKMSEKGIQPAAPASKEQWLRRVTYDITGLPPRPESLENFLKDPSDQAYETVVDRLLGSPAYGERMASLWMDVARYADSHGYQDDRPRTMWPWRDWVIQAFNDNLPYDDFVTWQIAGDLLPDASYAQKLATGFNRNHAITQEGGVVQEEYLTEYAADRTHTFATAFLGLTMECARCHSHKFDPISQKEYYSLLSFFNNIPERGQISYFDEAPLPNMPVIDAKMDAEIESVKNWIVQKEAILKQIKQEEAPEFQTWLDKQGMALDLKKRLEQGLLAEFDFNHFEKNQFAGKPAAGVPARMNINLPPSIPLPDIIPGRTGKALQFDGANFLSLGEIGDFEWYDAFSFGGWIKYSRPHPKDRGVFARRVGEQKRQGYDLTLSPKNQLSARLIHQYHKKTSWGPAVNFAIDVQTKKGLRPGQWHYVFVTYDGSGRAAGLNIYINGKEQDLRIKMDSLRNKTMLNGNDFLVGNWNHRARELEDLSGFKGGMVDHVWLYDRELSPPEVKFLFTRESTTPKRANLYRYYLQNHHSVFGQTQKDLDSLRRIDLEKPHVMIMQEVEDSIKPTFVLERGAYDSPGEKVIRSTPQAVLDFDQGFPKNRLGLAMWLFDDKNPLTGRVFVNRLWQLFFGQGLVTTPEDFGNQGALPSHPELLDWLAVQFEKEDWDIKKMVKTLVLSASYRQDAAIGSKHKDIENTWLGRGPTQRLTAEMLRDQVLVASGLYYQKTGGKWVKPYQPSGIWKELANQIGENKYREGSGRELYRRSLYSYWKRTIPPPDMLTFDASERAVCTVNRQQTSTPLQSLVLLNNPLYVEGSRKLAERILETEFSEENQVQEAFKTILSRTAKDSEIKLLLDLYQEEKNRFEQNPDQSRQVLSIGASDYNEQLPTASLAALTVVINAVFNLDEAKHK